MAFRRGLSFLFLFLGALPLHGQPVNDPLPLQEEMAVPSPLALKPNWWDYFNVKGEDLQQRVDRFSKDLSLFQNELSPEQQEKTALYLKKVYASLETLPKLSQQTFQSSPERPFLSTYSIEQQLELSSALRTLEATLKNENKELQLLNKRTLKIASHLDDMMAAYLRMEKNHPDRLVAGLEILSSRFILAVNDEKKRLIRLRAEEYSKQVERLNEELKFASANPNYQTLNEGEALSKLEQLNSDLYLRQKQSLRAELNSVGTFGNTLIERATAALLAQKAINIFTEESLVAAEILFYEAKKELYLLMRKSEEFSFHSFEQKAEGWKKELEELSNNQQDWKKKSTEELERIGQHIGNEAQKNEPSEGGGLQLLQSERYHEVQETLIHLDALDAKIYQTRLLVKQLEKEASQQKSSYMAWWYQLTDYLSDCCSSAFGWLHRSIIKIGDVPITPVSLFQSFTILGITYFVSWFLRKGMSSFSRIRKRLSESSLYTLDRVIHYVVLLLGCTFALSAIGLDFSNLLIVLGALSVGIGFGLQSVVNNFVCSLIILFSRNVKVGDYIQLTSGDWGKVSDVNVQNTIIKTWDGIDVVVPNSELISGRFINWTMQDPYKRIHVPFVVPYGTDKEMLSRIVIESAMRVPGTISNHPRLSDPKLWLVNFGDWSLEFELIVWINVYGAGNYDSLVSAYKWEIDTALRGEGIESPFQSFYGSKTGDDPLSKHHPAFLI